MKKISVLLILTLVMIVVQAGAVFAQTDYTDSTDVVPIPLTAEFTDEGYVQITWHEPQETDLDFYVLLRSNEDSTPEANSGDAEILLNSNEDDVPTIEDGYGYIDQSPYSGVAYYRTCVYTILSTRGCGEVVSVYGDKELVLDPIVESFPDIAGHWAEKYIEKLRVLSVVEGRNGNFEPNSNIYRAEAIKILMLAFGIGGTSCHADFYPDMSASDWFCDVVSKATQEGYVEGDDGILYPGREITRAEAVKVVLKIKGVDVPEITAKPFDDVYLDQWYAKYVAKAKELEIVEGVGSNKFEPNRSITRAELSKIAAEAAEL